MEAMLLMVTFELLQTNVCFFWYYVPYHCIQAFIQIFGLTVKVFLQ